MIHHFDLHDLILTSVKIANWEGFSGLARYMLFFLDGDEVGFWCGALNLVLCVLPLALGQTYQGATVSFIFFGFQFFRLLECNDFLSKHSTSSAFWIETTLPERCSVCSSPLE
jgi:hypothetical protein